MSLFVNKSSTLTIEILMSFLLLSTLSFDKVTDIDTVLFYKYAICVQYCHENRMIKKGFSKDHASARKMLGLNVTEN